MGRWEPGASSRLRQAAMDLYLEHGFEQTTVADIAERAGLTARTFFRYFADKREVLFGGASSLQDAMVAALEGAPGAASPMEAIAAALDAAGAYLTDRDYSARRQSVINAHAELRERELTKMASLANALTEGLGRRGANGRDARLAAEVGVVVFRVGFERWVTGADGGTLAQVMRALLDELKVLTSDVDAVNSSTG